MAVIVVLFQWFCLIGMTAILIHTVFIGRFNTKSGVVSRSDRPRRFWTIIAIATALLSFAIFNLLRFTRSIF